MVVLKAIRRNNLYYLKGSTVTGQVTASTDLDENSTRLCHIRLGHTGEKSLQALIRQDYWKVPEPASWNFVSIMSSERRPRWSSVQQLIAPRGFWIMFTLTFGDLLRLHQLEVTTTLSFIDDYSRRCWVYTMRHKGKVLELFVKWTWREVREGKSRSSVQIMGENISLILSFSYVLMRA